MPSASLAAGEVVNGLMSTGRPSMDYDSNSRLRQIRTSLSLDRSQPVHWILSLEIRPGTGVAGPKVRMT